MDTSDQLLIVPIRTACPGIDVLRTGQLPDGTPVGIAFTSREAMELVMGPGHQFDWLGLAAAHDLLAPLGISRIQVDPIAVAAGAGRTPVDA